MYYIIGPERSAEALAQKDGLRRGEWKRIGRFLDAFGREYREDADVVLSTHDAWQLKEFGQIHEYVVSHTRRVRAA